MLKLPQVVVFDIDDTIYDYESNHDAALEKVKKEYTNFFKVSSDEFDNTYYLAKNFVKSTLGDTASSHNRLLYFQKMSEIFGLGPQILKSLELEHIYWREFLRGAHLYDNVLDFLELLRHENIKINFLTDLNSQIQFRKLIHFQIEDYVDAIVTSEESGVDKPARKNYQLLTTKNQDLDLHYWVIGDNISKDIDGAKNISSVNAILKRKEKKKLSKGDLRISFEFENYEQLIKKFLEVRDERT